MKRKNAGVDMWLQTQTATEKLKQNSQTPQDADDMQALSMLYMRQVEVISQQFTFHVRGRRSEPPACHVSSKDPAMRHAAF